MSHTVVGVLGRGASAVVDLAVADDGTLVARKRLSLHGSTADMDVARRRLRREAEILTALHHPGVVEVLAVEDDGADVVLVMPAFDGNLADAVRAGRLPPAALFEAGRVLLGALAAAHHAGVVHRDIKPANVLVDHLSGQRPGGAPGDAPGGRAPVGRFALADFGAATSHDLTAGLTLGGTVIGTPRWIAPEQARGEPAGPAADVFSLAATLLWAATGWLPWGDGPAPALMARAATGRVEPLPGGLDPSLAGPLRAMLRPDPAQRPSAGEVLGGLTSPATLGGRPEAAARTATVATRRPPVATRRPAQRGGRRSPAERPAAGGLPVGLAAARRLLLGRDGQRSPRSRRHVAALWAVSGVALAAATAVVVVATTGPVGLRAVAVRPPAPVTATCVARPFEPCGTPPAPHTDGTSCLPGWYDLDRSSPDGCEARSDWRAGTMLARVPLRANLVPPSAVDTFTTEVEGPWWSFCGGTLDIALTSPPGATDRAEVYSGRELLATATSFDGQTATAQLHKPGCIGTSKETLTIDVTDTAGATGDDFTLARSGSW